MRRRDRFSMSALLCFAVLGTGCGTAQIRDGLATGSPEQAAEILRRSAEAHGGEAWSRIRDVNVRYDGTWLSIVDRVQPVLVDKMFRKGSEERFLRAEGILAQAHRGPAGTKQVVRTPEGTRVWYNGVEETDPEKIAAAGVVADAYRMFLTGPFFFQDRRAEIRLAGTDTVDGAPCDRILAVLRPGFGPSAEDRAFLSIDRETGLLRRVRFTLEGLASTRGAEVDTTFGGWREVGGVRWPTEFYERVRAPLRIPAHRWKLLALDLDRGLAPEEVTGATFSGAAGRAATALP